MIDPNNHPLANLPFPKKREEWTNAPARFSKDKLEIYGHPVMERWETPYMQKLAEIAASQGGVVLEIGFGLGISAGFIQEYEINEHHIIEANAQVFRRVIEFARAAEPKVIPYFGFWQDVVNEIPDGTIDGILFDTYPITADELHTERFSFFCQAHRLLRKGGVFTHYSGEIEFTPLYLELLNQAGFFQVSGELCPVSPPANCLYWNAAAILAPRIVKE